LECPRRTAARDLLVQRETASMMPKITVTARVCVCSSATNPSPPTPNTSTRCVICRDWKSVLATTAKNCTSLFVGNARCLHWAENKPDGIDTDQLRYNLEDHLGSCVMELDQQAQLISQEGYYPFGATAWMSARSPIEVSYKFIRYSGKEMDVSGLYYYGARYYAPWLLRWVSTDAEQADGLNLYGFVGNNPMRLLILTETRERKGDPVVRHSFISAVHDMRCRSEGNCTTFSIH
jgi:RHS repeat-associated protein